VSNYPSYIYEGCPEIALRIGRFMAILWIFPLVLTGLSDVASSHTRVEFEFYAINGVLFTAFFSYFLYLNRKKRIVERIFDHGVTTIGMVKSFRIARGIDGWEAKIFSITYKYNEKLFNADLALPSEIEFGEGDLNIIWLKVLKDSPGVFIPIRKKDAGTSRLFLPRTVIPSSAI